MNTKENLLLFFSQCGAEGMAIVRAVKEGDIASATSLTGDELHRMYRQLPIDGKGGLGAGTYKRNLQNLLDLLEMFK